MWRLIRAIRGRHGGREEPPEPPDRREGPRIAARRPLRLGFSLSVLDPRSSLGGEAAPMLEGRTRDISTTGVALAVPSLSHGGHDISRPGQVFLLEIELPTGPLRFQAATARHELLVGDDEEGYVLGVRITEISQANRARLAGFLRDRRS